jgi:hypothetical protein
VTAWAKMGLIAAFLVIYGVAVWRIHDWRDASKEVKAVTQEEAATLSAMKTSSAIDTRFGDETARFGRLKLSANQQMEAIHETPATPPCGLDARRVSILRSAIAAGHAAR